MTLTKETAEKLVAAAKVVVEVLNKDERVDLGQYKRLRDSVAQAERELAEE